MEVLMNNDVKDYIVKKAKDNSIRVILVNSGSGWSPNFQPSVRMGKPSEEKEFKLIKVGDINVYVKSDLKFKDNLVEISLSRFLWTKYLNVKELVR